MTTQIQNILCIIVWFKFLLVEWLHTAMIDSEREIRYLAPSNLWGNQSQQRTSTFKSRLCFIVDLCFDVFNLWPMESFGRKDLGLSHLLTMQPWSNSQQSLLHAVTGVFIAVVFAYAKKMNGELNEQKTSALSLRRKRLLFFFRSIHSTTNPHLDADSFGICMPVIQRCSFYKSLVI